MVGRLGSVVGWLGLRSVVSWLGSGSAVDRLLLSISVRIGSVRVIAASLEGGLLFSLSMSTGVRSMGPWVLRVLTVVVLVARVGRGTSTDGSIVLVSVASQGVVALDLCLGVSTPVVVGLRLVVRVAIVVVLLSGVGDAISGALKVSGVVVGSHSGVDSLGLLLVVGVRLLGLLVVLLLRVVVVGHGSCGDCESDAGFHFLF